MYDAGILRLPELISVGQTDILDLHFTSDGTIVEITA